MLELEMIAEALQKFWWLLTIFASLIVIAYRVRAHEKVVYDERGEVVFISKNADRQHWADQEVKNKVFLEALKVIKHAQCPEHYPCTEKLSRIESTQQGNIMKLNALDESAKETKAVRKDIFQAIDSIRISIAGMASDMSHLKEKINDLKEAR